MLTIKHITPLGFEGVFEAREVFTEPICGRVVLGVISPSKEKSFIEAGTVYVMNELGKTVSVYEVKSLNEESPNKAA
jgi:hypothetical protein